MLINQMGVEDGNDVVDLDSRRTTPTFDPKRRETLTTLLEAALTTPPEREEEPAPPRTGRRITPATTAEAGEPSEDGESRINAA